MPLKRLSLCPNIHNFGDMAKGRTPTIGLRYLQVFVVHVLLLLNIGLIVGLYGFLERAFNIAIQIRKLVKYC